MGQAQSHNAQSPSASFALSSHNQAFGSDDHNNSPVQQRENPGFLCFNVLCPSRPIMEVPDWKAFIQRRLGSLESEEWSGILMRELRGHNNYNYDVACQNEVRAVGAHTTEEQAPQRPVKTEIELKDQKSVKSTTATAVQDKSKVDPESINEDCDAMEVSHSKMFCQEESWMKTSFDIKPKDRESILKSFDYLKDIRDSSSNLETANSSQEKTSIQNRVSSYRSQYDNFTVLMPGDSSANLDERSLNDERIKKYKSVLSIIEKHLNNPDHIFRRLIVQFENYYVGNYGTIIEMQKSKSLAAKAMNESATKATTDLQVFIGVLYEAITIYYRLDRIKKEQELAYQSILNRDNVMNFLTSLVFSKRIYQTIFDVFCTQDTETEALFQKNLKLCEDFLPEDFGVAEAFCLNARTLSYLQKQGKIQVPESRKTSWNNSEIKVEEEPSKYKKIVEESKKRYSKGNLPYQRAITILGDLTNRRSPIHKLKNITKAAELISQSIDKFYKSIGTTNKKRLDADQTLCVFIYMLAKSGLHNVSAHYKIIEKFTTNNILNSTAGYYATTLGACVACLCTMGFNRVSNEKENEEDLRKYFQSSKIGGYSANSSVSHNDNDVL